MGHRLHAGVVRAGARPEASRPAAEEAATAAPPVGRYDAPDVAPDLVCMVYL